MFCIKKLLLSLFLFCAGFVSFAQSNPKKEQFITHIREAKDDSSKVLVIDSLVQLLGDEFDYDTAYDYAKKGIKLSERLRFKRGKAIHLINCAGVLVRKQNQTKALEYLFQAYEISQKEGYLIEENKCLSSIAFAYTSFNNYQEAISYRIKQCMFLEKLITDEDYRTLYPENLNKDSLNLAQSISSIAFYQTKLNHPQKAIEYGFLGLNKASEIVVKDPTYMSYPLNCIGIGHRLSNRPDSALFYFRKSLEYTNSSMNEKKKVTNLYKSYWEIAIVYQEKQLIDSSIHYGLLAESYCKKLQWDKDLVDIQLLLAKNYGSIDPQKSILYYDQAILLKDQIYSKEKEEHLKNITFNEHERQAELEEMKRQDEINRRDRIQYSLIALSIFIFVLVILVFSKRFQMTEKTNAFLTTLALLMVFEFLNLVAGPYLDLITADYPALSFTSAIVCSFLLFPFEARFERWLAKHMGRKGTTEQ